MNKFKKLDFVTNKVRVAINWFFVNLEYESILINFVVDINLSDQIMVFVSLRILL